MTLLLVCKTPIIIQIFKLIAEKLYLDITVESLIKKEKKYDLIVLDEEYIREEFNSIKQYSKKLGAISTDKLSFDKSSDFEITRPFLPKQLQDILQEQINYIKEENKIVQKEEIIIQEEIDESLVNIEDFNNYADSIADYIVDDLDNDNDESILSLSSLNDGGVLDTSELSKINQILLDSSVEDAYELDEKEWKDLSDVIDEALCEVRDFEFDESSSPIELVLNNYNIEELSPLFAKVDQSIIDRLTRGESIDLKLSLKV